MLHNKLHISKYDPELWEFIEKEMIRQENHIELIASENYASVKVMYMQGSQLTNKYAEGYPEKRYYNGCEYIDMIEKLAISRAKNLFSADYANVQPHSGSQANFAVYYALLKPGDTILGMNLSHGGHLTHGSSINFSGKFYNSIFYGLDKFGNINYEELFSLAKIHKPKLIIGGFSSYSGTVDWKYMRKIADEVGAYLLVDMAHIAGLVAAGLYPNPIPYAHVVTATTHKTLSGPRGGLILSDFKDEEFYKKLNSAVFPGSQGGPLMHVIAAKAIAFKEAMDPSFKFYQIKVIENAKIMAESFLEKKFNLVSKIVYNHLFLLDLTSKNIDGKEASLALSKANIIVNKNSIPNDFRSPIFTSGIRIGTPAITRRGFNKSDSQELAFWMCDILNNVHNEKLLVEIKKRVLKICKKYPVYC